MKRVLCLYIPFLSTDRLRGPDNIPAATVESQGQALRIVHVNRTAYNQGIRSGQTLAGAKAIVPQLVTYDDDPTADRRQLESLAVWAGCLSPIVHIEDANSLIVDVTGCERLFGGEANLLDRAIAGLKEQGFSARGAIADCLGAAWAIAHAHRDPTVIAPPGQTATQLVSLPVWSLRIDSKTAETLVMVGVETIASLLHLPRSSLASRFSRELLDRLDQALGDLPEVLIPYRPHTVLTSRLRLGRPTTRIDVLSEATCRALAKFCGQLAKRAAGVRQMFITFYCPEVITEKSSQTRAVTLEVNLSQPTRSVERLFSLLAVLIDNLRLPAPADALMLWAREIDPLDDRQGELFTTNVSDARELADLVDRLSVRLGLEAVVRPQLRSEHQPERAFRYVPLVGTNHTSHRATARSPRGATDTTDPQSQSLWFHRQDAGATRTIRAVPAGPRPLRLVLRPIRIAATAVVPEGPPVAFQLHGTQHVVFNCVGPERIETGWWRGPHVQRDYYRVTTEAGCHAWVFRERDTGLWFLHGWFD